MNIYRHHQGSRRPRLIAFKFLTVFSLAITSLLTFAPQVAHAASPTATLVDTSQVTSNSSGTRSVTSSQTGTAYLVRSSITVTDVASITSSADDFWNQVTISSAATNTAMPVKGLAPGTYYVFAVNAGGEMSSQSASSLSVRTVSYDGAVATSLTDWRIYLSADPVVGTAVSLYFDITCTGGGTTDLYYYGSKSGAATLNNYASGAVEVNSTTRRYTYTWTPSAAGEWDWFSYNRSSTKCFSSTADYSYSQHFYFTVAAAPDTTAPTVSSFSSSKANGSYAAGATINITATASEAIQSGNTLTVTLDTGATVLLTAASAGTTLTGTYTVSSGETSADLTVGSFTIGTVADAAGNAMTSTTVPSGASNIAGSKALVIDTTAPTVTLAASASTSTSATITFTVTGNEAITCSTLSTVSGTDFDLTNISAITGIVQTSTTVCTVTATSTAVADDVAVTSTLTAAASFSMTDTAGNAQTSLTGSPKSTVVTEIAPTVSGVSSSTTNGSYKAAGTVSIQVTFSEAVTVTGTPQLTLETGSTDRTVNYASGTGTTVLTFTYTVQTGDTSSDLDYAATTSLALNSGTIRDAASNNATLTLPSPGAAGSLGANKVLVIDTTASTVTGVSSSTADGSYKAADTVSIQVTFSEAVTVTGTPQLTLETGSTDRAVNYASGTGTTILTFTYTVQTGDTSSDLDYAATTSLALNSGTIRDAASNNATLTLPSPGAAGSLGANKAFVIDTTAPTLSSSTPADNATSVAVDANIVLNFSETVTAVASKNIVLYTTIGNSVIETIAANDTTKVTVSSGTVTVNPSATLTNSIEYYILIDSGAFKDAANNVYTGIASTTALSFTTVADTTAPTVSGVSSSTANGSYKAADTVSIQVTFSEAVTVTGTPTLTLETGSTDRAVNYASGTGTTVLTFTYTVQAGDTSSDLDYVATTSLALSSGTIRDAASNDATLTLPSPGAADSLGANKALVIDTTAPTVTLAASAPTSTSATITFTVTGNEAITCSTLSTDSGTDFTLTNISAISGIVQTSSTVCTITATSTAAADGVEVTSTLTATGSFSMTDTAGNAQTSLTSSPQSTVVTRTDGTAPTVTLARSAATSTAATITFTVTGNEAITCSTLSTVSGTDFTLTNISAITGIAQTLSTVCTITATSSAAADGVAVTSTLAASGSFSMTDTAGNAQTSLTGSPQSTAVTVSAVSTTTTTVTPTPTPTTTTTTTTTTARSMCSWPRP